VNSKESLNNIRKKASAPRKQAQHTEECVLTQRMDLMNQQVAAQQHQIQHLSDCCTQLNNSHNMVLQEVARVQKTVFSHQHVLDFGILTQPNLRRFGLEPFQHQG
jgi:osomolarity two-component system response regulator SKN7